MHNFRSPKALRTMVVHARNQQKQKLIENMANKFVCDRVCEFWRTARRNMSSLAFVLAESVCRIAIEWYEMCRQLQFIAKLARKEFDYRQKAISSKSEGGAREKEIDTSIDFMSRWLIPKRCAIITYVCGSWYSRNHREWSGTRRVL